MKSKGGVILLVSLIFFGGIALWDHLIEEKKEEKKMLDSRLMTLNYEQIDLIQLEREDKKLSVRRTVDGWELTEPYKDLADNTEADDFVKNSFTERILEVANEGEDIEWSRYGLDKPLGKIILKTSSGEENSFEISEKRNFEDNTFARRNKENRVLVINSTWQNKVKKTAMDFRDRRFLRNKIAAVDSIKIENDKGVIELKRIDGKWQAESRKNILLDQNKVRDLLSSISEAKASEILDATPSDRKKLFTLKLSLADKKWEALVEQDKSLAIFAKVSEPQFKMKMEPGALDSMIQMTLSDLKEQPPQGKQESALPTEETTIQKESK